MCVYRYDVYMCSYDIDINICAKLGGEIETI